MESKGKKKKEKEIVHDSPIGVEIVSLPGKKMTLEYQYEILKIRNLGKEIKISPKSHCTINKAGYTATFHVETVTVCIEIGTDHVADLVMSVDAWNALQEGQPVNITTAKEFNDRYVYTKKV